MTDFPGQDIKGEPELPSPVGRYTQSEIGLSYLQSRADHIHAIERFPYGKYRRISTVQVIPTGVSTAVLFDTRDSDDYRFNAGALPQSVFTVPFGLNGIYNLTAQIYVAGAGVGATRAFIDIQKNAGEIIRRPFGTGEAIGGSSGQMDFVAGDTFKVNVFQSTGANQDITAIFTFLRLCP